MAENPNIFPTILSPSLFRSIPSQIRIKKKSFFKTTSIRDDVQRQRLLVNHFRVSGDIYSHLKDKTIANVPQEMLIYHLDNDLRGTGTH